MFSIYKLCDRFGGFARFKHCSFPDGYKYSTAHALLTVMLGNILTNSFFSCFTHLGQIGFLLPENVYITYSFTLCRIVLGKRRGRQAWVYETACRYVHGCGRFTGNVYRVGSLS